MLIHHAFGREEVRGHALTGNSKWLPEADTGWCLVATLVSPSGFRLSFSTKEGEPGVLLSTANAPVPREGARDLYTRLMKAGWQNTSAR